MFQPPPGPRITFSPITALIMAKCSFDSPPKLQTPMINAEGAGGGGGGGGGQTITGMPTTVTSTSLITPSPATTVRSTGWAPGASVRTVHEPGAAKKRN